MKRIWMMKTIWMMIKLQPLSLFLCPCKETPLGPTVEVHFLIAPLQTFVWSQRVTHRIKKVPGNIHPVSNSRNWMVYYSATAPYQVHSHFDKNIKYDFIDRITLYNYLRCRGEAICSCCGQIWRNVYIAHKGGRELGKWGSIWPGVLGGAGGNSCPGRYLLKNHFEFIPQSL